MDSPDRLEGSHVRDALARGESVPGNVLADYPELATRTFTAAERTAAVSKGMDLDAVEKGMNDLLEDAKRLDDELAILPKNDPAVGQGVTPYSRALHQEMDNFRIPDHIAADAKR